MREYRPASLSREATHAADPVVVANLTPLSKNFGCFAQRSEPALLSWTNRTFGIHSTGIGSYVNRMVTSSKILRSKSSSFLSEPSGLRAFSHRTCNVPGSLWNRSVSHCSSRSVDVKISSTSLEVMVLRGSNFVLDATQVAVQLVVLLRNFPTGLYLVTNKVIRNVQVGSRVHAAFLRAWGHTSLPRMGECATEHGGTVWLDH